MKALVGAFNQEKALVGAFSVIVQPVVEPMDRFAALVSTSPPTLTVDTLALWRETIENITNTWDRHETNNSERLFCHPNTSDAPLRAWASLTPGCCKLSRISANT